jgi:hypothetical protein
MEIKVLTNEIYDKLPLGSIVPINIEQRTHGYAKLVRREGSMVVFAVDEGIASDLSATQRERPVAYSIEK